ncbi:universal stress protein [Bythopirellula polymerisocia]|uniref:Universal stress protein E n=1 Tax=Bythopirellula polymerisocia TaxID=2528003 RepID=A0A5C6CK01_9BACT|nr:universal stress protein [Bythopirellula polymerisocia]TWU24788.1 Universal stress protein E [Bythopirellula polymerisocia]
MKRFKNILVGVDLADKEQIVANEMSSATSTAIENGLWLAKHNNAQLVFFTALEVPNYIRFVAEKRGDVESLLIGEYEERLNTLVQRAKREGIKASYVLTVGKSWVEMIRQVLKKQHDIVIVGTRQRGIATSALFGSTGMKLLRKCPCAVWVGKPQADQNATSILVADDLTPVSGLALELGVSMAQLQGAQLHVLHVLELGMGRPSWDSFEIRTRARAEAAKQLEAQLVRVNATVLQCPARIEIVVDAADSAILREIAENNVGLLVMATVARSGIAGIITGNTAERLLPQIPCSVLAIKPPGFESPVAID